MPPSYSKTRKAKLYNLIATKSDALEYWPCYPVYLRGEAGSKQIIYNISILIFLYYLTE